MNCEIHGTPLQDVCGTPSCGRCYGDWLTSQPLVKSWPAPIELVYEPTVHRKVIRKKRGQT